MNYRKDAQWCQWDTKEMESNLANRKRKELIKFYVTLDELEAITKKMKQTGITNRSGFLRKVAIDSYVIHIDYSYLKEHTRQIRMIGININQIAHHMNATGKLYQSDLKAIQEMLEEIWRLQRSILSSLR